MKYFNGEHSFYEEKFSSIKSAGSLSLKFWLAVSHTPKSECSNFMIEYLGEIETEFDNILACLSVAQMSWNHEKNEGIHLQSGDMVPYR